MITPFLLLALLLGVAGVSACIEFGPQLPDSGPLDFEGDIAATMVAGIDAYLLRELERSAAARTSGWNGDRGSPSAYARSMEPRREKFRKMIGLIDARVSPDMEIVATYPPVAGGAAVAAEGSGYRARAVRWSALSGVDGEGLMLEPDRPPIADVIALPDCDWTPEMLAGIAPGLSRASQFARRLVENRCRVLVPALVDRRDTYSGLTDGTVMTNQPHREFLYRAAYEIGRHIIGYEVQKVLAAVDWFRAPRRTSGGNPGRLPVAVIGYGEGGLLGLYAAASDIRIDAVAVSGYFRPREALWEEPIYRNIFGLLTEFGDAEIAALVAPRPLIIEAARHPAVPGPPEDGRTGAAPGSIGTPSLAAVEAEAARARSLTGGLLPWLSVIVQGGGRGAPGGEAVVEALLAAIGRPRKLTKSCGSPKAVRNGPNADARARRQFEQIGRHTQDLMLDSPKRRAEFWDRSDFSSLASLEETVAPYRDYFWREILGKLPEPSLPPNPRTRRIYETRAFVGYEVMLDLYQGVYAYGILLVPREIRSGDRRPVVVCQHGLEGRAQEVADPDSDSPFYHRFACRLAEQGFITYAPQNPYIGENLFRQAARKAMPLKLTLFSFIVRQHERALQWLAGLPYVDPARVAFYGLSYGGKTAMRVPAVLPQYCLSICSGDFNEWIWKNVSMRDRCSYLVTGEYEMPEFDLANTFNYAEMSRLICPRPFMVERGHEDGVAPDEWVAYEYAKTRRVYDLLGIGDRTEMEVFNGPHTIHGEGTFAFLHRWLDIQRDHHE